MTEKEFEQLYGRKPKKRVRYKIYWGRIFIALLILVLIIYLIVKAVSGLISIIKKTGGDDSSSMAAAVSQAQSAQADSGEKSKDEKQEDTVSDKIDAGALTVCIDAGHGGYDAGTTDMTGLRQEKTDTLEAALKIKAELEKMDDAAKEDAFYRDLAFGTGGLRGTIGAGTNRMNVLTVARASQGLANYLLKHFEHPSVVIGFDSRLKSDIFAQEAAAVFAVIFTGCTGDAETSSSAASAR